MWNERTNECGSFWTTINRIRWMEISNNWELISQAISPFFFFPFFIPARLSIPAGNGNRDAWHGGCNLKILIIIENIMGKYLSVGVKQSSSVSLKFPWKWIFIYVIIYNFERERERDKRFARNDRGRGSLSPRVITARLTGISARERERGKN